MLEPHHNRPVGRRRAPGAAAPASSSPAENSPPPEVQTGHHLPAARVSGAPPRPHHRHHNVPGPPPRHPRLRLNGETPEPEMQTTSAARCPHAHDGYAPRPRRASAASTARSADEGLTRKVWARDPDPPLGLLPRCRLLAETSGGGGGSVSVVPPQRLLPVTF